MDINKETFQALTLMNAQLQLLTITQEETLKLLVDLLAHHDKRIKPAEFHQALSQKIAKLFAEKFPGGSQADLN